MRSSSEHFAPTGASGGWLFPRGTAQDLGISREAARTPRRRGFTLVEVTVAMLIGVNLLYILYNIFISDQQRSTTDQGRLASLQGALLFGESIESDLRQMALFLPDATHTQFTLDDPVSIDTSNPLGQSLTFLMFNGSSTKQPLVATQKIQWSHRRDTGAVSRNGDRVRSLIAQDLQFARISLPVDPSVLGLNPAPVLYNPKLPIHVLKVQVTAVPNLNTTEPIERRKAQRVTMVFAVPLLYRAERANRPYWNMAGTEVLHKP